MANLQTETNTKTNGSNSEFKNKVLGAENQLEKMAHSAGQRVGSMASDFANSTAESMKVGKSYVKENPTMGVAIAAATGLVIGSLLTMAVRSRQA